MDFIKAAKAQPGKLNIGTIAVGGTQNLGAEMFKSMAGLNVQIVPYKNSPDIVVCAAAQRRADAGRVSAGDAGSGQRRQAARAGDFGRRSATPLMPGVPTVDEAGVKGYEVTRGTPSSRQRTPKEVIDTMNKAMHEVLAMPDVKEQFAKVGVYSRMRARRRN